MNQIGPLFLLFYADLYRFRCFKMFLSENKIEVPLLLAFISQKPGSKDLDSCIVCTIIIFQSNESYSTLRQLFSSLTSAHSMLRLSY